MPTKASKPPKAEYLIRLIQYVGSLDEFDLSHILCKALQDSPETRKHIEAHQTESQRKIDFPDPQEEKEKLESQIQQLKLELKTLGVVDKPREAQAAINQTHRLMLECITVEKGQIFITAPRGEKLICLPSENKPGTWTVHCPFVDVQRRMTNWADSGTAAIKDRTSKLDAAIEELGQRWRAVQAKIEGKDISEIQIPRALHTPVVRVPGVIGSTPTKPTGRITKPRAEASRTTPLKRTTGNALTRSSKRQKTQWIIGKS